MIRDELKRIVDGDGDEPARPFVNADAIREITEGEVTAEASFARLRTEAVVRTNAWLKEYEIDVSELSAPEAAPLA